MIQAYEHVGEYIRVILRSKTHSGVGALSQGTVARDVYRIAYRLYRKQYRGMIPDDCSDCKAVEVSLIDCGWCSAAHEKIADQAHQHDPDPAVIIEPPDDDEDTQPITPVCVKCDETTKKTPPNNGSLSFGLLLQRPIIAPVETLEQSAELHKDFLEMAYRRYLQTPDQHFRVSQWYRGGGDVRVVHSHKIVADKLAGHDLLKRHAFNNGSRSKYRISSAGISYVEAALGRWTTSATHDAVIWLPKFEDYAAGLMADGLYILPEPGRSWVFEQAFVDEKGRRSLHRIRNFGYPHGHGWDQHNGSYFYTLPDESGDYVESFAHQVFRQERVASLEIPF